MNSPDHPCCPYGRDSFMAEKGLPLNDYLPSFLNNRCLDKLEFFFMIPDTSLHQHNDVGIFDLDNLFCFQPDLFC